uniref:Uncharacterized protein n=1 Tax=Oryza nivara TaxID=4536 RepID=A0A0E0J267_ORYNI
MGIRPKTPPPLPTRRRVPSIQQNPSTPSLSKTKKKIKILPPFKFEISNQTRARSSLLSPPDRGTLLRGGGARPDHGGGGGEGRGGCSRSPRRRPWRRS